MRPTKISKIFIDRFKKLIGDVRSIDPKQVPTDVNLMGILIEALSGNEVLWGHLTFAKNISLEEMMDTVAKWKSKSQKSTNIYCSELVCYARLSEKGCRKEAKIWSS